MLEIGVDTRLYSLKSHAKPILTTSRASEAGMTLVEGKGTSCLRDRESGGSEMGRIDKWDKWG